MSCFIKFLAKNPRILLQRRTRSLVELKNGIRLLTLSAKSNLMISSSSKCSMNLFDGTKDLTLTTTNTMSEVQNTMMERLGLDDGYTAIPKSREHLSKYEPRKEDLPPRSMQDSYTSAIIPLSKNKRLQDKYVAYLGQIRLGRLMEDMDMFAVWVCHQHIQIPNLDSTTHLPYTFVTILVDKIDFTDFVPKFNEDVRLSGHVSWVGNSSMEIVVWLEQLSNGAYHKITRALFLMAARNATNTLAAPVNPLLPASEEEKKILSGGVMRKNRRQKLLSHSLLKVTPNDFEQRLIHNIFQKTVPKNSLTLNVRELPSKARWMEDSLITNTMPSFPENRNAHNKVFGGYLMRNALEMSWLCAYLYCASRPKLEHICDISFQKPVDVSSFIKMSSYVVYTELNYLQIMTVADVICPGSNNSMTTNLFYYTYKSNELVPEIVPKSYHETMWYLEGRRKFCYSLGLSESE